MMQLTLPIASISAALALLGLRWEFHPRLLPSAIKSFPPPAPHKLLPSPTRARQTSRFPVLRFPAPTPQISPKVITARLLLLLLPQATVAISSLSMHPSPWARARHLSLSRTHKETQSTRSRVFRCPEPVRMCPYSRPPPIASPAIPSPLSPAPPSVR